MSMGLQIAIRKIGETSHDATYSYALRGQAAGTVRVVKATGKIELVSPAEGEDTEQTLFGRVAFKLQKYWQKSEFPESTWWAS